MPTTILPDKTNSGKTDNNKPQENPHKGHRKNVLDDIMMNGLDELRDHEILEALLFFSVPMRDTNPLAHRLVSSFGSLKDVLEADYDELVAIDGITPTSARLIHFTQLLAKKYLQLESRESVSLPDTETLKAYCRTLYLGENTEKLYCLCLTHELKLIKCVMVHEGSIGRVNISPRLLAEVAIRNKCERIIIVHNHPQGTCMPSRQDMVATRDVAAALGKIDIRTVDHLIVGIDGVWSIRQTGALEDIWG